MTAWLDLGLTGNGRQLRMIPTMGDAMSDSFDAIIGRGALMCVEPGGAEDDFIDRLTGRSRGVLSHGFDMVSLTTVTPDDPAATVDGLARLKAGLVDRQHPDGDAGRRLHVIRLDVPYWSLMEEGPGTAGNAPADDAPDAVGLWNDCVELMTRCLSSQDGDTVVIVTPHVLDSRPLPKRLLSLIRIRVAVGSILQPAALALFYDPTKWVGSVPSRHITGDGIPVQTEWCGRMLSPTRIPAYSGTVEPDHDDDAAGTDDGTVGSVPDPTAVTSPDTEAVDAPATAHADGTEGPSEAPSRTGAAPTASSVTEQAGTARRGLLAVIAGWFGGRRS